MFFKSKLAIAAALILSAASVAQAGAENQSDPSRGSTLGPQGQRQGGSAVNPALHKATHHATRHKAKKPTSETSKDQT
jgi:hypothetical protein